MSTPISLHSSSIPYSFYNMRQGINDKLDITISTIAGGSSTHHSLTITPGNYTAFSLSDKVKTLINALSGGSHTFAIDMVYDADTQKFTYSFTTGTDVKISLNFSTGANNEKTPRIIKISEYSLPNFTSI